MTTPLDRKIARLKKELGPITDAEKKAAELDRIGAENEERIRSREIQRGFRQSTGGVAGVLNERRENRQG